MSIYVRLEEQGKIDHQHAFFPVTRDIWRFVAGDQYVDVYMEGLFRSYTLDIKSIDCWRIGKYEPFSSEIFLNPHETSCSEISDDERQSIIGRIQKFMLVRHRSSVGLSEMA